MNKGDFVHLHLHSHYSILDGAIKIEELISKTLEYGMPAVAVTDHGNMFSSYEFYTLCKNYGINPIIGEEFYIARGSRLDKKDKASYHLIILAKNNTGFKNLMKLSSIAFTEGYYYKPRIDKEVLEKHREGLIILSACIQGEIPSLILQGKYEKAEQVARQFKDMFGDDFYLEVQNHGLKEQQIVNKHLLQLSKKLDIDIVATNDAHYISKDDWEAHDVLLCLQTGKKLSDEKRMRFPTKEFYFKNATEMLKAFKEIPHAITNTLKLAEKVNIEIKAKDYLLPEYKVPEGYTYSSYLRKIAHEGMRKRFEEQNIKDAEKRRKYEERLEYELKIIDKMGFPGYFLIVWDFINWAKKNNIPVGPGRGSAAGSLVAYAIGITNIDPIKFNLLFERFLNPERTNMPDIDVDIDMIGRDKVIEYVREKYGENKVCQIITFNTLKPKGVVRDVGRVLGMPYSEVDRLAKLVPGDARTIEEAVERAPDIKELSKKDQQIKKLINIASKLQGLTRQTGVHAAGVVIAPGTLTDYIPIARSKDGDITTQYEMGQIEKLGLLKMDFLGLKTLTIIDRTIKLIKARTGVEIEPGKIPLNDKKTFKLLQNGNTIGVFQLESPGMRNLMKRLKPETFEDIIALVALYRPGPLNSGMAESYIKRKHGIEPVNYEFPELKKYLEETYGLFIYQEQIMQIANILAGYSLGEADLLRRAMGKKKREIMEEQKSIFINRAVEKGYPRGKVEKIFNDIAKFAEYGFNKSHSAAYALIAYTTAYLKAHYPRELMTTMLSVDYSNTDEIVKIVKDCRENGIEVLPPDVNLSDTLFKIEGNNIRFGLAGIKGMGEKAAEEIVKARKKKGKFTDLYDFCEKVDLSRVNRKVIESLIKAGAFDSTGQKRAVLMEIIDKTISSAHNMQKNEGKGLMSLFGKESNLTKKEFPKMDEWPDRLKLEHERSSLGFYLSGHPLLEYKNLIPFRFNSTAEIEEWEDMQEVKLAGAIMSVNRKRTQKGELWAEVEISDLDGIASIWIFPNVYSTCAELLTEGNVVVIEGVIKEEETKRIIAKSVERFESTINSNVNAVLIRVNENMISQEYLGRLKDFLLRNSSSNGKPVIIELRIKDYIVRAQLHSDYNIEVKPVVIKALKKTAGESFVDFIGEVKNGNIPARV